MQRAETRTDLTLAGDAQLPGQQRQRAATAAAVGPLPEQPRVVDGAAGQEGVEQGAGLRVEVARHDAGHAPEGTASARPGGRLLGAEPVQL